MNRQIIKYLVLVVIASLAAISGCSKESTMSMSMSTTASEVSFTLDGPYKVTINWGDGKSETVRRSFSNGKKGPPSIEHSYSGNSIHTITIRGQGVRYLSVGSSELISLDVSHNAALDILFCPDNQINILDISNNSELLQLLCSENQLTSLDVSNNLKLYYLNCRSNQLTSLDLSRNTRLTDLTCANNFLTSLDVSNNTSLTRLHCGNNQITSLDLSRNIALTNVIVWNNKLTADALNALFATLHSNTIMGGNSFPIAKQIYIGGNPGTDDCDKYIAESKGWIVISD